MITHQMQASPPALRPRTARRVLVANYSGYIVGDNAIFEALLAKIQMVYGRDVIVDALTAMPVRTRAHYTVGDIEHVYEFMRSAASRRHVREMIARADLVIIGGGDIVEGQLAQFVLVALAGLFRTPVVYAGVGVLLPDEKRRQQMLRWSVGRARYVATRDAASENVLRDLGVSGPPLQTLADLAVELEQPALGEGRRLLAESGVVGSRPYVALNLRPLDDGQYTMRWGQDAYSAVITACQTLVDRDGYDIVCVPLVSAAALPPPPAACPADDELMLAAAERIGRPDRVHVLRGDYRPREIAALVGEAQMALGMRLHFLLLAAMCGTPIVALSYARKVRSFMQRVGLERFCLDISGLDELVLGATLAESKAQRDDIARTLATWRDGDRVRLESLDAVISGFANAGSYRSPKRQAVATQFAQVLLSSVHLYERLREGQL